MCVCISRVSVKRGVGVYVFFKECCFRVRVRLGFFRVRVRVNVKPNPKNRILKKKKKLTPPLRITNSRISPISSLFLEIEATLFAVNRIQKGNLKNTRGKT